MAHKLYTNESGETSFGFVGSRDAIWHGLGQQLEKNSSIEEWVVQAGFDWDIKETPVRFCGLDGELSTSETKKVLYRSDIGSELSVVGSDYKVVQPKEILEFFRDIIDGETMYLDTAGILFGGRRFFANASTNKSDYVGSKEDTINCNILLVTSCDSSLASQAAVVSTRVVCANTLKLALAEQNANRVRVTHRQNFNPEMIKSRLGLIDSAWGNFIESANKMASKKISNSDAQALVNQLVYKDVAAPTPQEVTKSNLIFDLYNGNGMGSQMQIGNLYGLLNAFTEAADHHNKVRSDDNKVWSKFYGAGDKMKQDAFDLLLSLA